MSPCMTYVFMFMSEFCRETGPALGCRPVLLYSTHMVQTSRFNSFVDVFNCWCWLWNSFSRACACTWAEQAWKCIRNNQIIITGLNALVDVCVLHVVPSQRWSTVFTRMRSIRHSLDAW